MGFSIVELTASVVIFSVLLVAAILSYGPILAKADAMRCMGNMRSLHTSLAAFVHDNAHWPQEPDELWEGDNEGASEDWWIETLTPYGGEEGVWKCPTLNRQLRKEGETRPRAHYSPTRFDEKPFTPFRWSTQPWLVEIGNMHGRGAHIIFPDGSIRVMSEFLPQQ
jgi:type II secretory pathway pseudopilin PulG